MTARTRNFLARACCLLTALLLASCGGGDGDGGGLGAGARSAGLWTGTAGTNRNVTAVTLRDGRQYLIYDKADTPGTAGGMVDGTYATAFNAFTSTDARDYSLESVPGPVTTGTVSATLVPKQSFNGTLQRDNATNMAFTTGFDADFDTVPTSSAVAGTYTGTVTFSLGPRAAVFVVDNNGGVSSVINGCNITGQMNPRGDGNVYDLSITFGASPCIFPNETLTGIGYYRSATRELRTATSGLAATNPGVPSNGLRNPQGVVFIGSKNL